MPNLQSLLHVWYKLGFSVWCFNDTKRVAIWDKNNQYFTLLDKDIFLNLEPSVSISAKLKAMAAAIPKDL